MKTFHEIRATLMSTHFLLIDRKEKTRLSMPVPAKQAGKKLELVFLTDMAGADSETRTCPRPYAWMKIDAEKGQIVQYQDCSVADFIDPAKYPMDAPVANLIDALTQEEFKALNEAMTESYEKLRVLYFDDAKAEGETAALQETYRNAFFKVIRKGQYPFYQALNPDFFRWMGMTDALGELSPYAPVESKADTGTRALVMEQLEELKSMFREKILTDKHKNEMFDNMHKELIDFRNDASSKPIVSMALDVIALMDSIPKIKARVMSKPEEERAGAAGKQMDGIQEELQDILYRAGFENYQCEGNKVDIKKQKIIGYVPSEDAALENQVAERLGDGFEYNGRIIRAERIKVYKKS